MVGSAIFNLFVLTILQNTKPIYPVNLPPHYELLRVPGSVLTADLIPDCPKISPSQKYSNEFFKGVFEYREISDFMSLDNSAIFTAMKNLLTSLQTQTNKIQKILSKIEKKQSQSVRNNRVAFLRQKYPTYFPNQ